MTGHMNLRRQYVQAKTALDVGSRKKPYLWIHYFGQVALTYILEQATRRLPGTMICHEGLLELKKHDKENQTQYMETLRVYLEQHLSATQAARELFIHRSTFLYRLDRIKEILQSELDDPEEILSGIVIQAAGAGARERIVREQNSADIWKGQLFVEEMF